ncbi:FMN adenylyltransferase / Riboflavin kinase, partial [hydrothermal vent metagenome]
MRPPPCVITVGNFDGVHIGHAALIARARELAHTLNAPGGVVVLAFNPHPRSVLHPGQAPASLMSFARRAELLCRVGAGAVHPLDPTDQLLALSPADFIEWVNERYNPIAFVEGPDFHFGCNREGSMETLRALGRERGFAVEAVPVLATALSDHTIVTASSTITRWLIEHGRVRDAWNVLGRPHRLAGTVVRGERRGRDLGFPTANLDTPDLLPVDGVYATLAHTPDGRRYTAALSVGTKPQFHHQPGPHARTAEAFLLDAPTEPGKANLPGLPEYGWDIAL